jgi:hypothetical protein
MSCDNYLCKIDTESRNNTYVSTDKCISSGYCSEEVPGSDDNCYLPLSISCPSDVLCRVSSGNRWLVPKDGHSCNIDKEKCLLNTDCCFEDNECFAKLWINF